MARELRFISVKNLKEALNKVDDSHFLCTNNVGNLCIFPSQDHEYIGYINFVDDNSEPDYFGVNK